ncbi:MAG: hypothetical protein MJZ00_02185 [Paludibacteraceae bacterium]|nr:hypothetical protein [Paludibacteraceae bacterium]
MKKRVIPVLALAMLGFGSYATTYMVVTQSDGTVVEYDVEEVKEVSYRIDSIGNGNTNPDNGDVVLSAPCVAMCDNEFAVKTLNVVGNNLYAPLVAKFWDGKEHSIVASTEDGSIVIYDSNHAKINIPDGVADNGTIVFENSVGSSETDFIFRDTRNLLITHDDKDLNKFNGQRPDSTFVDEETGKEVGLIEPKETIISKYFQSENTNGNFSIFHRDGSDFIGMSYEPYNGLSNPDSLDPKYPTVFGPFGEMIAKGEMNPNDFVIKFEVFVPSDAPMKGDALTIGFFNAVAGESWVDARRYCSCWQPSIARFPKDENGVWDNSYIYCDAWSTPDWITVTIPMEELRYDFQQANYRANPQGNRLATDGYDSEFAYYGDKVNGLPYFSKYTKYKDLFEGESPLDLGDASITGLSIVMSKWDCPEYNTNGRHPYIAVDNVRIVPKDNNGGVWPMFNWGEPERDFYSAPVIDCK